MSNGSRSDSPALENLSALADGELDPSCIGAACAAWRDDAALRDDWHAWHLIGDVLRSEDLAIPPVRDAAFIAGLRARLAAEPTVLAPEPLATSPAPAHVAELARASGGRSVWAWKAPAAVAAGFVMVAGALVVTRNPAPAVATQAVVAPSVAAPVTQAMAPMLPPVALSTLNRTEGPFVARPPGSGPLLRDARLDRYLAAHKQFAGSSALGVPSGFLRNAAAEAPSR